jgi:4-hydroxy-3-methylbut-2-enyl diphosphate reductase
VVFSAHGVSPMVHAEAEQRNLRTIDATCPLVTKVHKEVNRFAKDDYDILLIGHEGHEEVEGTAGEAPDKVQLVDKAEDVGKVDVRDPSKVIWLSQTTLSVDETMERVDQLRERFPGLADQPSDDICYATTNRQAAVKQLARECDLVLVIGSSNSSNSNRLVEVAEESGCPAHLIDHHEQVREDWLTDKRVIGITSGASAPEGLVQRLVEFFRSRGTSDVGELEVVEEDVRFMLPKAIRQAMATASA